MKIHLVIVIASLILGCSAEALIGQKIRGEHVYRPAFQKKLKRVQSIKAGSFKALSLKKKSTQKEVYIDWRKLYWGNLCDLIYSEEEIGADDIHEIESRGDQVSFSSDTEDTQAFAKELRQELKAFAKQYGLKIVWRKKSLELRDVTAAFLEYWDMGLSQEDKTNLLSFDDLLALSGKKGA